VRTVCDLRLRPSAWLAVLSELSEACDFRRQLTVACRQRKTWVFDGNFFREFVFQLIYCLAAVCLEPRCQSTIPVVCFRLLTCRYFSGILSGVKAIHRPGISSVFESKWFSRRNAVYLQRFLLICFSWNCQYFWQKSSTGWHCRRHVNFVICFVLSGY